MVNYCYLYYKSTYDSPINIYLFLKALSFEKL
jgi:hypothetical protein